MAHEVDGLLVQVKLALCLEPPYGVEKKTGDFQFSIKNFPLKFFRQKMGNLIEQEIVVAESVTDKKIFPDDFLEHLSGVIRSGVDVFQALFNIRIDSPADKDEDIDLRGDVFIQSANRDTHLPGQHTGGGLVVSMLNKEFDSAVNDLPSSLFNKFLILYLGGNFMSPGNLYRHIPSSCFSLLLV